MSKKKRTKKPVQQKRPTTQNEPKVVKTSSEPKVVKTSQKPTTRKRPTSPKQRKQVKRSFSPADMIFGRENYVLMIAGLVLVIIGMMLMSGGSMPDPNTWDEGIIYSPVRITVAPLVILIGLIVEIVAIFRVAKPTENTEVEA